jgi:hypothetical protein
MTALNSSNCFLARKPAAWQPATHQQVVVANYATVGFGLLLWRSALLQRDLRQVIWCGISSVPMQQ